MPTYLSLEYSHDQPLPPGQSDEIRTPDALVEHFLREYSEPGDRVIDVFAGFGTTLAVAEELDRIPYGLEFEDDRIGHTRECISRPENVRHGDVLELDSSWFPTCNCCFTSPPFMERTDDRNPFRNYTGESSYGDYLDDLETAFENLDSVMAPGASVIVHVANLKHEGRVTTLAWDLAKRVSNVFDYQGETVVTWEAAGDSTDGNGRYGYGYDHSYCHVFRTVGD